MPARISGGASHSRSQYGGPSCPIRATFESQSITMRRGIVPHLRRPAITVGHNTAGDADRIERLCSHSRRGIAPQGAVHRARSGGTSGPVPSCRRRAAARGRALSNVRRLPRRCASRGDCDRAVNRPPTTCDPSMGSYHPGRCYSGPSSVARWQDTPTGRK